MAIVYNHINKETKEVFYVGIGKSKTRAFIKRGRNALWKNIVTKYGYDIELTHQDISWEEACSIEKYLISFYGRRNLGKGTLCNMTDGGEGEASSIQKNAMNDISLKQKIGIATKNRWKDEEMRKKIITSMLGRICSEETRIKKSKIMLGEKNPNFGRTFDENIRKTMSQAHLGKGHKQKEETKDKIRQTLLGRKHTEERKQNMRKPKLKSNLNK